MLNRLTNLAADGASLVVGSSLTARQLEPYLRRESATADPTAWVSPSIQTYRAWTTELWARTTTDSRQLLTNGQAEALWRRVIDDSASGRQLISSRNASRWAMEAWETLWHWRIEPAELRAGHEDIDFRCFLDWAAQYRQTLTDRGWVDAATAEIDLLSEERLGGDERHQLVSVDLHELTPAQIAIFRRVQAQGGSVQHWQPAEISCNSIRMRLADRATEVSAAATWAAERLRQRPEQRLAIIVPDLSSRNDELRRALVDALDPDGIVLGSPERDGYFSPGGEPIAACPTIGAAMTALELVSTRGSFQSLSRWLRSSFFSPDPGHRSQRAMIEAELRGEISAQLSFRQAFKEGSFALRLRDMAPDLATMLGRVLRIVDAEPRRATPTRWSKIWEQVLAQLEWQPDTRSSGGSDLQAWESALNSLTLLTPILGSISMTQALDELDLILSRPRGGGPVPLHGVALLERPEDLGHGYDATWLCGMTDDFWPRAASTNPLLPLKLQRAHDMPGSSPGRALESCRATTQRLLGRVPELIFSWPDRVHEYPSEPSPLLADIREAQPEQVAGGVTRRLASRQLQSAKLETIADDAPPLAGEKIAGGAGTLNTQASCPLRAFIERRLDARPLDLVTRGLGPRLRGIATHRALELLLAKLPDQAELSTWTPDDRVTRAADAAETALQESFGVARALLPSVYRLEFERLGRIIESLIEIDLQREPFRIQAVEAWQDAEIKGYRLACRLDRVDALDSGGIAVIDYKTGNRTTPNEWLRTRIVDTQLPLYAQIAGSNISATAIVAIGTDSISYKGMWQSKDDFPGRATKLSEGCDWPGQIALWKQQLETLVIEFAGGDTRILMQNVDDAGGALAPLTRIIEQLEIDRTARS